MKQTQKENNEKWNRYGIFIIIATLIAIIAAIYGISFIKNSDNYWQNFWTAVTGFSAAVVAILVFYFQLKTDKREHRRQIEVDKVESLKQNYIQFQDSVQQDIAERLINFDTELSEYTDDKNQLKKRASDLAILLYTLKNSEAKRNNLPDDEEADFSDFSEIKTKMSEIISAQENQELVKIITRNYFDLTSVIDSLKNEFEETSNNVQGIGDQILGYWILNFESAQNAKYLVGVSTFDKRILSVDKLDGAGKAPDIGPNRILFKSEKMCTYILNQMEKAFGCQN